MPEIIITERTAVKPTDDNPVNLALPDTAWRGVFAEYRDLVSKTTEAADAFHFATFLQVFGCTLGRRLSVYHAVRLYANFYTCLVGRSGLTRKDTTWSRGRKVLDMLHAYPNDEISVPFKVVVGIRSFEGLLDELAGVRKVRLIQQGELLSLLAKARQRQDSLGNTIPALTELYDSPDLLNPPVHQKNVTPAKEPFLSIMAGTTQDWLQKALTEPDIYGGFANRWLYFIGSPKGPLSNPPKVDKDKRDKLVRELNMIREWAESVPDGEITMSDEANARFDAYYVEYYKRCQQPGLIPTLIARVQDFIFKIALLYAAEQQSATISAEHLEAAIAVGNYLESCVQEVFSNFGSSSGKAEETRLLEFLRNAGAPVPEREVYRRLTMSAKCLEITVQPLIKLGLVKNDYIEAPKAKGKKLRTFEAV